MLKPERRITMFKISVIIPMHNDAKYLKTCIESVINQTFGFENIQLIMVDDCSEDSSFKIAQGYQTKYPDNIIAIKLPENSGAGGIPRNKGLELATGKYLMFSDADDFFENNAFEVMYNAIEENNADFVTANYIYTDYEGNRWEKPVFDLEKFDNFKLDIDDYNKTFYVMNSSMCNKIFNREFILKHDIKCLEGIPGEDTYFSMKAFLNAENVYYIKDIIYCYRQRNSSYKTASVSWNCSKTFFIGMSEAYKKIYDEFVAHDKIEFYRFLYARNMTYLLYRFIDSSKLTEDDKLETLQSLRWFFKLSHTLKVPPTQKSLSILITKLVNGEYNEVINICKIIAEMRTYMDPDVKHKMSKPYDEMYKEILKKKITK